MKILVWSMEVVKLTAMAEDYRVAAVYYIR